MIVLRNFTPLKNTWKTTWVLDLSLHNHQDRVEHRSSPLFFQLGTALDIPAPWKRTQSKNLVTAMHTYVLLSTILFCLISKLSSWKHHRQKEWKIYLTAQSCGFYSMVSCKEWEQSSKPSKGIANILPEKNSHSRTTGKCMCRTSTHIFSFQFCLTAVTLRTQHGSTYKAQCWCSTFITTWLWTPL